LYFPFFPELPCGDDSTEIESVEGLAYPGLDDAKRLTPYAL